jgi:hypothetical protein
VASLHLTRHGLNRTRSNSDAAWVSGRNAPPTMNTPDALANSAAVRFQPSSPRRGEWRRRNGLGDNSGRASARGRSRGAVRSGQFFWSGRTSEGLGVGPKSAGGNGAAESFATSNGGTTLEGLLDRNGVIQPKWSFDDPAAEEWWSRISGLYAENVQGEVRAVVGSNLRPGNVWETVELPRLMANANVTKIVIIDPETGVETTIFER